MVKKIILFYGSKLPNLKHIKKMCNLYINRFMKARCNPDFKEDEYIEYIVEFINEGQMAYSTFPIHVPIHRNYIEKFFEKLYDLKCNFSICNEFHDHPNAYVDTIEYEGYGYCLESGGMIIFFEHWITKDSETAFKIHAMNEMEWYRELNLDERYKIIDETHNCTKVFNSWVMELVK